MMVDSYFEGQRVAALRCQESGLAMVNLYARMFRLYLILTLIIATSYFWKTAILKM